jgi:branched-chain amino acid transport system permease protein
MGWVLLYKGTRTLNFAAGQFYLLGAAVYLWLLGPTHNRYLAAALATVAAGIGAALVYRLLIRRLAGQPEFSAIILTLGLSVVLQQTLNFALGTSTNAGTPLVSERSLIRVDHQPVLTTTAALSLGLALLLLVLVLLLLYRTQFGIMARAVGENAWLAAQSGVPVGLIGSTIWLLGMGAVALGGVLYSSANIVDISLSDIGLLGIAPALIGGLDSVPGALVGSIATAAIEYLASTYFGAQNQDAVLFGFVMLLLLVRPQGLFGSRRIERA